MEIIEHAMILLPPSLIVSIPFLSSSRFVLISVASSCLLGVPCADVYSSRLDERVEAQ
jgi:hypothetical protein